ncbi:hypothetical protein NUW54_g10400 [Trametes sanguinea]|uniref:Uncharacterized protein n=1 Tax=Trametes sanguinea TaxID=158606 RepID=A0ACC1NZB9_9APHY|nr:hypothetical protein NUW54_g10400 [Trametes sanguinea]
MHAICDDTEQPAGRALHPERVVERIPARVFVLAGEVAWPEGVASPVSRHARELLHDPRARGRTMRETARILPHSVAAQLPQGVADRPRANLERRKAAMGPVSPYTRRFGSYRRISRPVGMSEEVIRDLDLELTHTCTRRWAAAALELVPQPTTTRPQPTAIYARYLIHLDPGSPEINCYYGVVQLVAHKNCVPRLAEVARHKLHDDATVGDTMLRGQAHRRCTSPEGAGLLTGQWLDVEGAIVPVGGVCLYNSDHRVQHVETTMVAIGVSVTGEGERRPRSIAVAGGHDDLPFPTDHRFQIAQAQRMRVDHDHSLHGDTQGSHQQQGRGYQEQGSGVIRIVIAGVIAASRTIYGPVSRWQCARHPAIGMTSPGGLHVFADSGAPDGLDHYPTVIVVHGYVWHGGIFFKVLPLARSRGARVILLNRKDYPGAASYSAAGGNAGPHRGRRAIENDDRSKREEKFEGLRLTVGCSCL